MALVAGVGVGIHAVGWVRPPAPPPVNAPPLADVPLDGPAADPSPAGPGPGWTGAAAGSSPAPPRVGGAQSAAVVRRTDWWHVFERLDRRRVDVLAEGDSRRLGEYAVPGSSAHHADAQLLADLAARGVHPEGLSSRILAIEDVTAEGSRVRARIVDLRSGYRLVDVASGKVVERVARAGARRWEVILEALADPDDVRSSPGAADADRVGTPDDQPVLPWRVVSVQLSD